MKWVYAASGVMFAGMIFNPNYTSPRSFYLRKINVVFLGWLGYCWGRRQQDNHMAFMLLRMNDYFPLEVRRAF